MKEGADVSSYTEILEEENNGEFGELPVIRQSFIQNFLL